MFVVIADASELVMSQLSPLNCGATDPVQLPAVRQSLLPEVNVHERSVAWDGMIDVEASKTTSTIKRVTRPRRWQHFGMKSRLVAMTETVKSDSVPTCGETVYLTAADSMISKQKVNQISHRLAQSEQASKWIGGAYANTYEARWLSANSKTD